MSGDFLCITVIEATEHATNYNAFLVLSGLNRLVFFFFNSKMAQPDYFKMQDTKPISHESFNDNDHLKNIVKDLT